MTMTDQPFALPEFSANDRASREWARVSPQTERMLDEFMGQWRQALAAIVPANVEIQAVSLDSKPYSQFVKEAPAFSDIQVYEIEALQSLCAWSLDVGFVSAAVDSMFGGTGRVVQRDAHRPSRSPIETGVRRRLFEALATAYESVWQGVHPLRLNPLRQEALMSSLRLSAPQEQVVHARFRVLLNQREFALEQCLPLRALECLSTEVAESPAVHESAPSQRAVADRPVVHSLQDAPVEVVAMLGDMHLTVAQVMSLSIGQVLPFNMNDMVPLRVDGVRVLSGRSGVRHGRHAIKVDLSSPLNLQGLKAEFTPLTDGLRGTPGGQVEPQTDVQAAASGDAGAEPQDAEFHDITTEPRHEPQPPQ